MSQLHTTKKMKSLKSLKIQHTISFMALIALAQSVSAQVAIDFNNQASGQLSSQAGPTGTTGDWGGSTTTQVQTGQLTSTYALTQSGTQQLITSTATTNTDAVTHIDLSTPLTGTVYLSYIAQLLGSDDRLGLTLNSAGSGFGTPNVFDLLTVATAGTTSTVTAADVRVRKTSPGGTTSNVTTASGTNPTTLASPGSATFYVVRLDFDVSGTNDQVRLWVNPDLSSGVLGAANYDSGTIAGDLLGTELSTIGVGLYATGGTNGFIDNVRFSTSLSQVAVIPEPSAMGLLLGGVASFLVARRRAVAR